MSIQIFEHDFRTVSNRLPVVNKLMSERNGTIYDRIVCPTERRMILFTFAVPDRTRYYLFCRWCRRKCYRTILSRGMHGWWFGTYNDNKSCAPANGLKRARYTFCRSKPAVEQRAYDRTDRRSFAMRLLFWDWSIRHDNSINRPLRVVGHRL